MSPVSSWTGTWHQMLKNHAFMWIMWNSAIQIIKNLYYIKYLQHNAKTRFWNHLQHEIMGGILEPNFGISHLCATIGIHGRNCAAPHCDTPTIYGSNAGKFVWPHSFPHWRNILQKVFFNVKRTFKKAKFLL